MNRHLLFALLAWAAAQASEVLAAPSVAPSAPSFDPNDRPLVPAPAPPRLEPRPWTWRALATDGLPSSIQLFEGDRVNADGQPVRAWYAAIDYSDRSLSARAVLSEDASGREATSVLATKSNALLAVNGGYFSMSMSPAPRPAPTLSLVLSQGRVLVAPVESAKRTSGQHFLSRGAFGVRADRTLDVAWVTRLPAPGDAKNDAGSVLWNYPAPIPNRYSVPAAPPSREFPPGGSVWEANEGIGGAPVLVERGEVSITAEAEAIGPEMSLKRHPRTLIGWAGGNRMLLLVCDGRQPKWSMGLTLPEAAQTMRDLGCVEALNLDGGGSSTFIAMGRVLNKPSDGHERTVSSIWAITKQTPSR